MEQAKQVGRFMERHGGVYVFLDTQFAKLIQTRSVFSEQFQLVHCSKALLHHLSVGCGTFVHQLSDNMALTFPVRAANSVGDLDGVAGVARAV